MFKLKQWWAAYAPAGGSHVIWASRIQYIGGFVAMVLAVAVEVLYNNTGLLSAFTTDRALLAELQIGIGIAYEVLRRYKADDL